MFEAKCVVCLSSISLAFCSLCALVAEDSAYLMVAILHVALVYWQIGSYTVTCKKVKVGRTKFICVLGWNLISIVLSFLWCISLTKISCVKCDNVSFILRPCGRGALKMFTCCTAIDWLITFRPVSYTFRTSSCGIVFLMSLTLFIFVDGARREPSLATSGWKTSIDVHRKMFVLTRGKQNKKQDDWLTNRTRK